MNLIVHLHQSSWVTGTLLMSSNISKGISFLSSGLNSGLKIFSKPCCQQTCCLPGFVVPFIEHRQSRFSIILKGLRIFRTVNDHWLQLQVISCISPNKRVSLSFDALKPGTDFSSLPMKILDGIFFQHRAILKICCIVYQSSLSFFF